MQVKLKKSFKILFLITLFIVLFFVGKNNVLAYVWKGEVWNTMPTYAYNGNVSANTSKTFNFNINNSNINSTSVPYDLVVFKFNYFRFYIRTDTQQQTNNVDYYCTKWVNSGSYYTCETVGHSGDSPSTNNITGYEFSANFYMTATAYWGDNGDKLSCFMSDELKDMIICPIKKNTDTNLTKLELTLTAGDVMHYDFELSGLKYYFNYESSEMTNQQTITNTNLQYIYQQQQNNQQYLENDSTTGASTSFQSGISDLTSSFNSQLSSVSDLTQMVLLPISLFMDLSTDNCTPLHLQVPFVNYSVDIPCMKSVYNTYFGTFFTIFGTIMASVYCYWVGVNTLSLIKDIVDCDNDRIEVVEL